MHTTRAIRGEFHSYANLNLNRNDAWSSANKTPSNRLNWPLSTARQENPNFLLGRLCSGNSLANYDFFQGVDDLYDKHSETSIMPHFQVQNSNYVQHGKGRKFSGFVYFYFQFKL